MGHQSYLLLYATEEEKQKIIKCIKEHNSYWHTLTKEQKNNPEYDITGEPLECVVSLKILKARPKYASKYTHAIICGNSGGRFNTIDWFENNNIEYLPYKRSHDRWLSSSKEVIDTKEYVYEETDE